MAGNVPALAFIASVLCGEKEPETVLAAQVCDSGKVTDHHAIVPTKTAATGINIGDLPTGERNILLLVARSLLRAVCPPYRYAETAVTVDCGGNSFSAKGKEVMDLGWRTYAESKADTVLPDGLTEGAALAVDAVRVKTGQTAPPKSYTEDILFNDLIDDLFFAHYVLLSPHSRLFWMIQLYHPRSVHKNFPPVAPQRPTIPPFIPPYEGGMKKWQPITRPTTI